MSSKFLDKTGLDTLWAKIKSTFQTLGNLVTAWGSTPSDTKYPSEKLVKDSLDAKVAIADVEATTWGANILLQAFLAKNGTTVDNTNKTITATYDTTKSTDVYCYASTIVPIVSGETYTISFDIVDSNLTEGQYWDWSFLKQGRANVRITGNGHYSITVVSTIDIAVGYGALIDDSSKNLVDGSYIVFKNIKYEIGKFETKYSDLDFLLRNGTNASDKTLGPMIRALGAWNMPVETEYIPSASSVGQGKYTFRKIFDFFKSLMVSDTGVDISGNAGTASAANPGSVLEDSINAKATDSAVLHKAGLETATGQKWFEGGFCVFNTSNVGYGHYTLPGTGAGTMYDSWPEEYKDGAHFREWRLSFNTGVNFWGKLRITIATSFSSFNASGSMQKTINCAFNTATVFNNTGYYNDLGINSEKEFRISDLIWNNTTACWEIKIHSIKPASNNAVPVLLIEFWTYSTTNRDSALRIHWVSASPDIVTDTTYYTKRTGNASTTPGTGGVQFNWADTPVQQSPYGYEIFNRSHTIPVRNGGTGATTAIGAEYNILNQVADIDTTIDGNRKIALCNQTKSASNGVFRWLKLSNVWTWIKGLLSSESGVNISGNAATATTAAGYTSGGAIDTALQGKATPADITSAIQALDVDSQGGDGKYIKAISEADGKIIATAETMDTAPTANSTKAVTSGGVKTALDDKQDNLGISSSGDAGKFLNEQGNWETPAGSGVTGVKGENESDFRTGDVSLSASDVGAAEYSHQHSTSDITSGTLPVGRGGTGKASVTAGNYLVGNGTSAFAEKTPTAAANDMLSALPEWTANPTDNVKLIRRDTGDGASFGQVTFLTVWNYIKTKIYNGLLGNTNRPVYWTGSNLGLSKPSPNADLMGSVGKTTAAAARADTDELEKTTINCNNGSLYFLNAMKFIPNVPYTFFIPSVNAGKSALVASIAMTVYQIGASQFSLGTNATFHLDKAGGSSSQREIVFAYRVGTTLYVFHQY